MKIVSLLPSSSEILGALELLGHVVAVSHECDFPGEVAAKLRITSSIIPHDLEPQELDAAVVDAVRSGRALYQIDGDLLARLQPDLIVTQGICDVCAVGAGTVEETLKFLPVCLPPGAKTLTLSGTTVAGIFRDIVQVAEAAGVPERGAALVETLQKRWNALQETSLPVKPLPVKPLPVKPLPVKPKVLVLEWSDPPFSAGHWVPEMVGAAGGVDVLGQPGMVSRRVLWAEILKTDPDLVLLAACGYGLEQNTVFAEELYAHPEARQLRAVKAGQVYAVDANAYFSRPGPRVVQGAELLQGLFRGKPPSEIVQVAPVTVNT